jgi:hypothetical protein
MPAFPWFSRKDSNLSRPCIYLALCRTQNQRSQSIDEPGGLAMVSLTPILYLLKFMLFALYLGQFASFGCAGCSRKSSFEISFGSSGL